MDRRKGAVQDEINNLKYPLAVIDVERCARARLGGSALDLTFGFSSEQSRGMLCTARSRRQIRLELEQNVHPCPSLLLDLTAS